MPDQVPGLLTAVQILEQDKVVTSDIEPIITPGGRVLTKGISNTEAAKAVELTGFTAQSGLGRGGGTDGPVPLGNTYSPGNSPGMNAEIDASAPGNQGFLARVVCEAIDKELPEMAEVEHGVLIYLLNRYAGYDEFLADPMIHSSGAPRYKLDATFPTPVTIIEANEEEGIEASSESLPFLTDEEIHENRKKTYLYRFIECVFNDIKNNPHVIEKGVTATGEVSEGMVTEKEFLSCADLKTTCLECIQAVLDVRGWNFELPGGETASGAAEEGQGIWDTGGKGQSPCDGKLADDQLIVTKEVTTTSETEVAISGINEIADYINLLLLAPHYAINKVVDNLGLPGDEGGELPQPCPPVPDGDVLAAGGGGGCSGIEPCIANHLQADVAGKLDGEGLLSAYFTDVLCPAIKLGFFIMPLPPLAKFLPFELALPLATMAWFESGAAPMPAPLPGTEPNTVVAGAGSADSPGPPTAPPGFTPPAGPREASEAESFDPNTLKQVEAAFMNLAQCLGKDLDRDVVPALFDGSIKLLSLSVPSPIIPWAEITELETCTLGGGRELGPHMAHAVLEWAVMQIHVVDLRILAMPVAVGPPPYIGLMCSIPPPGALPKEPPPGHPLSEQTPGAELTEPIGMGA